jgi:hypothetical protein
MNKITNYPVEIISELTWESHSLSSLLDVENIVVVSIREKIQQWIENNEAYPAEPTTRCSECGKVANFSTKQAGYVRTKFGLISYLRAGYLCPHCHHTTYPLDERLNPVESLARMRTKIAAGKILPVSEIAQAWGLGTLEFFPGRSSNSPEASPSDMTQKNQDADIRFSRNNHLQIRPVLCQTL